MSLVLTPRALAAGLALSVVAACARATVAAPTPAPSPAVPGQAPAAHPAAAPHDLADLPKNWQLLDESIDHVPGISLDRAESELLAGMTPKQTVLVAVIDGGVDTAHVDLRANLWSNPKEVPGNAKDDDGNGYADDVHGWNFLGGADGRDVHWETEEVTRLYAKCTGHGAAAGPDPLPAAERPRCAAIEQDYQKKRAETDDELPRIKQIAGVLDRALPILRSAVGDSLSPEKVRAMQPATPEQAGARQIYLQLASNGISPHDVYDARTELQSRLDYGYNTDYYPRTIVGDDPGNTTQRLYGNSDVMGPDAKHGTHVSGIIGAIRDPAAGVGGIAPAVKLLMVRAVPDGDERDKDIANAIRYAVDVGAKIISMSFGKPYSPYKSAVDDAVRYADAHGVLMVHAAGNDGQNNDVAPNFPTPYYLGGGRAQNWIEVGASSWKDADSLAASFSNYGRERVDVFAPGVDILSTVPGGYERDSGTSMASPVVAGLAALLMDYYPNLSAADVKRIILASATRYGDRRVVRPGSTSGETVPFASLSVTGGIVNAYAALKMAAGR